MLAILLRCVLIRVLVIMWSFYEFLGATFVYTAVPSTIRKNEKVIHAWKIGDAASILGRDF